MMRNRLIQQSHSLPILIFGPTDVRPAPSRQQSGAISASTHRHQGAMRGVSAQQGSARVIT
ncbi:hypothetical protein AQ1_00544 [alpha proteobacterium Q-1]|nr:hypothetical protein AQ1_00544 [alpha proteobacterium Q-1]